MFVAGCVSPVVKVPSDEQVGSADYGEKPDMAQVEKNIKAWAIETLKDPSAMQLLDISSSSKEGWLSVCLRPVENECYERNFYFGHIVTAKINAKNSHGGYSGYKTYSFLFHGNKIVFYLSPDIIK
jgi:hypothetical protein